MYIYIYIYTYTYIYINTYIYIIIYILYSLNQLIRAHVAGVDGNLWKSVNLKVSNGLV
jgi:hypothetical protein